MVWTRKAAFGRPFAHQGAFPQRPPCRAALPPVPAAPCASVLPLPVLLPPLWGLPLRWPGVLPRRAFPVPSPYSRAPRRLRCGRGAVPASFSGPAGPSPVRPGTGAPPVRGARFLRGGLAPIPAILWGARRMPSSTLSTAAVPHTGSPLSRMHMGAFAIPFPRPVRHACGGAAVGFTTPGKALFLRTRAGKRGYLVWKICFFSLMGAVLQFFYERSHKIMQWREM